MSRTAVEWFEFVAEDLYNALSSDDLELLRKHAERRITRGGYAEHVVEARGYFMAHVAELLSDDSGSSGPIQSLSVGEISKTFAQKDIKNTFDRTDYGGMLEDLKDQNESGFGPVVT